MDIEQMNGHIPSKDENQEDAASLLKALSAELREITRQLELQLEVRRRIRNSVNHF